MKRKSLIALGLASIFILSAVGCNNTDNAENTNIAENKVALATSVENTETALEDTLIYGTVNLPYADFYYGELKQIEPETDAVTGQYDVNDIVASFGYEAEGMYDAVTSATTSKSKRFEATYFEEVETGVNILGVANVNVAISKALYDDVQNAITNGTICQNPLVELVSAMTVSEQTPAEYKVINSDGTLSKTIGNTVTAENVTATLTTISSWGNYQINFEGLDVDAATVQGAILETNDGAVYGLQHEDNLWLQASELSFPVEPFTESHGNEVAYQRFADVPGKTITKITYLIANADDIVIPTDLFCNYQLSDEYGITGDETVTYSKEGTSVHVELTTPNDSTYNLSSIKKGKSTLDISGVSYTGNTISLPADFTPGSYKLNFEDETYSGLQHLVTVDSGLTDDCISFDGTTIQITSDTGLTGADFIANLSTAHVNGEKVSGKGLSSIIFTEEGALNLEATTKKDDVEVEVFPASSTYEVTLEATGFPSITFEVTR